MWELLTRGSSPYPGVSNYYVKDYVDSGLRLDRPSSCPPIMYVNVWLLYSYSDNYNRITEHHNGLGSPHFDKFNAFTQAAITAL